MAKKAAAGKRAFQKPDGQAANVDNLPWENVKANQGAPWFRMEEGATLVGEIVGRYRKRNNSGNRRNKADRYFYQFKLLAPAEGVIRGGEVVKVKTGELLNCDETAALEDLAPYLEKEGRYAARIVVGAKITLDNDNTFWQMESFDVARIDKGRAPSRNPTEHSDEDAPF